MRRGLMKIERVFLAENRRKTQRGFFSLHGELFLYITVLEMITPLTFGLILIYLYDI